MTQELSNNPGLGEVPAHWQRVKAGWLFSRKKMLNTGMSCANRLALTMKGVIPRSLEDAEGLQPTDYETYQLVHKNDLLFKLIDLENVSTSRVGIVPETGIVSPAYIRLEPILSKVVPKFGYYWFYSLYLTRAFNQMGAGVRQSLTADDLLKIPVLKPPVSEQEAIVRYLDRQTDAIDALITKKEALLGVLDSYWAAKVAKVLEAHSEKSSVRLKWLFNEKSRKGFSDEEALAATQAQGVIPKRLLNFKTMESASDDLSGHKLVEVGDFVISLRSFEGGIEHSAYRGVVSPAYTVLEPCAPLCTRYFRLFFKSPWFIESLGVYKKGIRDGQAVPWADLKDQRIPFPSLETQEAVAQELEELETAISTLREKCESQIEALRRYRTSVITAAVTGKLTIPAE